MLTAERAAELLRYNPRTGEFSWISSRRGVRPGVCGRLSEAHGYIDIGIDHAQHRAHRLAFLLMGQALPAGMDVDHINGDKADNRWSNLRLATRSQNAVNAPLRTNNTSGNVGVTWDKSRGSWRAQARVNGVKRNLGRFASQEAAASAVSAAMIASHGDFVPAHARPAA